MRKDNKTIYELLNEARESVTVSRYFKGEKEELDDVCSQLTIIAAENGDVLPKQFEIQVQEGNLLYKIREFFMKMNLEPQKIIIGVRKDKKIMPIEVTLK